MVILIISLKYYTEGKDLGTKFWSQHSKELVFLSCEQNTISLFFRISWRKHLLKGGEPIYSLVNISFGFRFVCHKMHLRQASNLWSLQPWIMIVMECCDYMLALSCLAFSLLFWGMVMFGCFLCEYMPSKHEAFSHSR